jgi:hypothetical protein
LFFQLKHEEIALEENEITTFEQEGLLNEDGLLQIKKSWWDSNSSKLGSETHIYKKQGDWIVYTYLDRKNKVMYI